MKKRILTEDEKWEIKYQKEHAERMKKWKKESAENLALNVELMIKKRNKKK